MPVDPHTSEPTRAAGLAERWRSARTRYAYLNPEQRETLLRIWRQNATNLRASDVEMADAMDLACDALEELGQQPPGGLGGRS